LIGAYKIGPLPSRIGKVNLTFRERPLNWFIQLQYEYPFMTTGNYTPGKELDGALGIFYNFGRVGPFKELAPMFTVYGSVRTHDLGIEANTPQQRLRSSASRTRGRNSSGNLQTL
jgi:hypothetical protein